RPADLEPASVAGGAPRRDLGRPARGLGRRRAACFGVAHARLLDGRPEHRPDPRGDAQPREPRLPRALRRADRARLAPVRRALRPLRGRQPRDPAQRPERALAAALPAAVRADGVSVLPGTSCARRPPASAHGDPRRQLALARRRRRPVVALAVGGVRTAAAVLGALALLAAGTACGERTEPTGAVVWIYPVTVQ